MRPATRFAAPLKLHRNGTWNPVDPMLIVYPDVAYKHRPAILSLAVDNPIDVLYGATHFVSFGFARLLAGFP